MPTNYYDFWYCLACEAHNNGNAKECEYCECQGYDCKRKDCSDPKHLTEPIYD